MAVDMFLMLKGAEGETKDDVHKKEKAMDILSWSWGMSQSGTWHYGGGGGSGKADFGDITVTKYVDKASPTIMKKCANGDHFEEGKLTVRKAGKKPQEYLVLKMEKVMVASVQTGGSGGEERLIESVTLNFAKVNYQYKEQKDDGSLDKPMEFAHNIETNKAE